MKCLIALIALSALYSTDGSPDNPVKRPGSPSPTTSQTAGRAGRDWWSLKPLAKIPVPRYTLAPRSIVNPIDAFIFESLHAKGLSPAPPADRQTLIRRVTFDLIGLPPTPAEIQAFLTDNSPMAYTKLVDRLLADPRYGERWGRHWLDVARFCESNGFERDQFRPNAWRYRDYVIDSLNEDIPYARFVREQIAGDVLQPRSRSGLAGSAFLVVGPWDEVGNTQVSSLMRGRVHEEEMEEMVGTVCQTFLGLTANCARCHDHKFDPIPQRDYYRLKAALEGAGRGDLPFLTAGERAERDARLAQLNGRMSSLRSSIARIEADARARAVANHSDRGALPVKPLGRWTFDSGSTDSMGRLGGALEGGARISNGRLVLDGKSALLRSSPLPNPIGEKTLEAWLVIPDRSQRGGGVISLQKPDGTLFDAIVFGEREPGKWSAGSEGFNRTANLAALPESSSPDSLVHVAVVYQADNTITIYRNGAPYAAPYTPSGSGLQHFPAAGAEVVIGLRHRGAASGYLHAEIEEARIYDRALSAAQVAESFRAGVESISDSELLASIPEADKPRYNDCRAELARLEKDSAAESAPPMVFTISPKQPEPTRLLERGDILSQGLAVSPGGLTCVVGPSSEFGLDPTAPEAARRIKLADWISSPANPLTARVIVNRIWHYHFGRGIVSSPNDFGFNGDAPSHPALLDWLAKEFNAVSGGNGKADPYACAGRLKALHRLILLSNTYCQSSRFDSRAAAKDADDRLLWRYPPHRLEGEAVRDAMLSVSGQLNPARGGPSFQPFKVVIDNSTFYQQFDSGAPEFNRRTIYRANVNSARNPLLETLDCPDPSTKTPRRAVTTTPLQALELMNSSFVQRQALMFARRIEQESQTPDVSARVRLAYELAFGRPPTLVETSQAVRYVHLRDLRGFCWSILNSSEFLYVQ